jgi:hypothetical protein
MKTRDEVNVLAAVFITLVNLLDGGVSDQFHTPATLPPRKELTVPVAKVGG